MRKGDEALLSDGWVRNFGVLVTAPVIGEDLALFAKGAAAPHSCVVETGRILAPNDGNKEEQPSL